MILDKLKSAIQDSTLISETDKRLAIADLEKIETDHDYQIRVGIGNLENNPLFERYKDRPAHEQLNALFVWDNSELGGTFWAKIFVEL